MGTRATLRADLRRDLRDEDPTAYVWTDAVLNRHIQHALDLIQSVAPRVARLTRTVSAAARRIDLSADLPASHLWVEAVEYPIDRHPACLLPFREEAGPAVLLLTEEIPVVGDTMALWYAARYTFDDGSSDVPGGHEPAIAAGALAFACQDQAIDAIGRINPNGAAPAHYRALGDAARARFDAMLDDLRRRAAPPMWRPAWPLPR